MGYFGGYYGSYFGVFAAGGAPPVAVPAGPGPLVNGVDLATLGLVVNDDLSGWLDTPRLTVPTRSVPGRGPVVIGEPTSASRLCALAGWIKPGAAGSDLDALALLLSRAPLEITLPGHTTRVYRGRAIEVVFTPKPPVFASGVLDARVTFECPDPLAYETTLQTIDFGAATPLPLGTAPVRPVITLGGVTNPVLVYRDADGVERGRLELAGAFTVADPLVVDCARCTLALQSGANQAAALVSGDFLVFDPRHGSGTAAPTLEVTPAPSGTGDGARAEYARAYRSL